MFQHAAASVLFLVSSTALAGSGQPPEHSNAGGLPQCKADLGACEADLDACDHDVSDLLDEVDRLTRQCASPVISAAEGGRAASADGKAFVTVPPGALTRDTPIVVKRIAEPVVDVARTSDVWDFGPDGLTFSEDATICLPADVAKVDESCLGSYDPANRKWTCDDACVRSAGDRVCGSVGHFTQFAILLGGGGSGKGCDDGGSYILGGSALGQLDTGTLDIRGGDLTFADDATFDLNQSTLSIGGGNVSFGGTASLGFVDSSLTVTGGNLSSSGDASTGFGNSTLTIGGGSVLIGGTSSIGFEDSSLSVTGGNLRLSGGSLLVVDGSSIAVSGGGITLNDTAFLRILPGQEGTRVRTVRERSMKFDEGSMLTIPPTSGQSALPAEPGGGDLLATGSSQVFQARETLALGKEGRLSFAGTSLDAATLAKALAACPRTVRVRAADATMTCEVEGAAENPKCLTVDTKRANLECENVLSAR